MFGNRPIGIPQASYFSRTDELRRVMPAKLTSLSEGTITSRQKLERLEREIQATRKLNLFVATESGDQTLSALVHRCAMRVAECSRRSISLVLSIEYGAIR